MESNAESSQESFDSVNQQYEWFNLKIVRNRFEIEFENPEHKRVSEEITLIHKGSKPITDFPIPIPIPRDGIKIYDEDNSLLSFLSHSEIKEKIEKYDSIIRVPFLEQLDISTIIWITLPAGKEIQAKCTRIIRFVYWPFDPYNPKKVNLSLFDVPIYNDKFLKNSDDKFDTFYLIRPPKNFIISIDYDKTYIMNEDGTISSIKNRIMDPTNLNDNSVTMVAKDVYVNMRLPSGNQSYGINICYKVELQKAEKRIWKVSLPLSWALLTFLIILPLNDSLLEIFSQYLHIYQETILTISGVVVTLSVAIIALVNNPVIFRTRYLLLMDVILVIVLLLVAPNYPSIPTSK